MLTALLIYSIAAGIAVVQLLMVVGRRAAFGQRLLGLNDMMRAFHAAKDDDTRQSLLLQAGTRTVGLSLLLLITLAIACLVMALPWVWLTTSPGEVTAYMAGLTVSALLWWRFKRPRY